MRFLVLPILFSLLLAQTAFAVLDVSFGENTNIEVAGKTVVIASGSILDQLTIHASYLEANLSPGASMTITSSDKKKFTVSPLSYLTNSICNDSGYTITVSMSGGTGSQTVTITPNSDTCGGGGGPACGDTSCNGSETCLTCPGDCGVCPPQFFCGDTSCNGSETCLSCPGDCGACPPQPPVCGDATCNGTETCSSCPGDCGVCPPPGGIFCGDTNCNGLETCSSCPGDCGVCPPQPPGDGTFCGDTSCSGSETCSTCPGDCGICPPPLPPPPEEPPIIGKINEINKQIIEEIKKSIPEPVKKTAKATKELLNTETGNTVAKTIVGVSTVVAVSEGMVSTAGALLSIKDIFLLIVRLFGIIGEFFGLKKRIRKWGVVYDSKTKRPLDPAYVVIYNQRGEEISQKVTDMEGRFGFLVGQGNYRLIANKTHYSFPSKEVSGKNDEFYDDVYHGEEITVGDSSIIKVNIPMDPIDIDWNEEIKKKIMDFNPDTEIIKKRVSSSLFWSGFVISPLIYWAAPQPFNLGILIFYVALFLLRLVGFKAKEYGRVYDRETGKPVPFAKVKVFLADLPDQQVGSAVADIIGKYYILLLEKGNYLLEIAGRSITGREIKVRSQIYVKDRVVNLDLSV